MFSFRIGMAEDEGVRFSESILNVRLIYSKSVDRISEICESGAMSDLCGHPYKELNGSVKPYWIKEGPGQLSKRYFV